MQFFTLNSAFKHLKKEVKLHLIVAYTEAHITTLMVYQKRFPIYYMETNEGKQWTPTTGIMSKKLKYAVFQTSHL